MKNLNPKRKNTLSHKIAVLANLMIETLDEIEANSELAVDFKTKSKELIPFCEKILDDSFSSKQIATSTYLSEVATKVDTVIRKSYQQISY